MNRVMKETPATVVIFYHGLFGLILVSIYLLIEAAFFDDGFGDGFRILNYTSRQYGILVACVLCDSMELISITMAYQNDRSGFIGLLSYMSIVYAYFFD